MPIAHAYDPDAYWFPDPALNDRPNEALLAEIADRMGTASDHVDGISDLRQEHVDFAQDVIAQCRDILLQRGVEFDELAKAEMSFLRWPSTEERPT
jgi:hypothetical protein